MPDEVAKDEVVKKRRKRKPPDPEVVRERQLKKYKYHNEHFKVKNVLFSSIVPEDQEMLEWLGEQKNISGYVKGLILVDMRKAKEEKEEEANG